MGTYVNQLIKQWQWPGFLLLGYGKRWTIQVHADVFIIISVSPFSIRILRLKVVNIFVIQASNFKRELILKVLHLMYIYAVFIVPLE